MVLWDILHMSVKLKKKKKISDPLYLWAAPVFTIVLNMSENSYIVPSPTFVVLFVMYL